LSSPRTTVLHILTRLDMGGSARNTLLTCSGLAGRYRMVLVHGLARESAMSAAEEAAVAAARREAVRRGVALIPLAALVRAVRPLQDARALVSLVRIIRAERPDIVHTHTSKAGILGRLAARLAGVRPIVHTPHGHVFYGHFGPSAARTFLALERCFARFTDRLVALTEGERRDYLALGVGSAETTCVIPSGVDLEAFAAAAAGAAAVKSSLGLDPGSQVVGFVGWLLPVKGPLNLLNAMAAVWERHPGAVLVFAGKGAQEAELRARARALGAGGRVQFLGWREDVAVLLKGFDLLVLPSLNEGMGRVLVEAMAAGVPVVASRTGGIPDLVRHEETGLLVEPGDTAGLSAAVSRLLASPAEAGRLARAGRRHCRRFGLDRMLEKLDDLYGGLIGEAGAAAPARRLETMIGGARVGARGQADAQAPVRHL
jgi:glycosyltransferase involved in cell wall biosynthesis